MILYHSAFGSLAGIIIIGDQCVPGVYLLFLVVILDLASRWINGISCITLVSMLNWSKSRNSTNARCYFGGHVGFGIKMIPKRPKINGIRGITLVSVLHWSKSRNSTKKAFIKNDRESSVLDSKHLQATFLKNQLSRILSISKSNAPGLIGTEPWLQIWSHVKQLR